MNKLLNNQKKTDELNDMEKIERIIPITSDEGNQATARKDGK